MENEDKKAAERLELLGKLRLLDDIFMTKVFEKEPECVELVLKIIMGDNDIRIEENSSSTQYLIKNLQGRDVWLDIHAIDTSKSEYDIEVQRADSGAKARRARLHSSLMDANQKDSGKYGDKLPETYVIFITENDVLGKGKAIYKIERYIDGESLFDDGAHIIYVNGAYVDDNSEIGRLMHDFRCTKPEDMYFNKLSKRVNYFKNTGEGEQNMCKIIEEYVKKEAEEAAKKATEKAMKKATKKTKKAILKANFESIKGIMKKLDYTAEEAMNLINIPKKDFSKYMAMF